MRRQAIRDHAAAWKTTVAADIQLASQGKVWRPFDPLWTDVLAPLLSLSGGRHRPAESVTCAHLSSAGHVSARCGGDTRFVKTVCVCVCVCVFTFNRVPTGKMLDEQASEQAASNVRALLISLKVHTKD